MARYALGIEYDGSGYCGWQRQDHSPSVQQVLEEALSKVADETVVVTASGRTDSGVHAWQQCVHFSSDQSRPSKAWVMGVNAHLPNDVSVRHVTSVSDDFHARHSTRGRTYRYIILNHTARSALQHQRVGVVYRGLNESSMQQAGQALVGEYDFTSFRAAGCQAKHAVREITGVTVQRFNRYVMVQIEGNAFLHNMVRIIVGSLISVGVGEQPVDWLGSLLDARDRTLAGATAVPDGLYFMGPHYDDSFCIPHWRDSLSNPAAMF